MILRINDMQLGMWNSFTRSQNGSSSFFSISNKGEQNENNPNFPTLAFDQSPDQQIDENGDDVLTHYQILTDSECNAWHEIRLLTEYGPKKLNKWRNVRFEARVWIILALFY